MSVRLRAARAGPAQKSGALHRHVRILNVGFLGNDVRELVDEVLDVPARAPKQKLHRDAVGIRTLRRKGGSGARTDNQDGKAAHVTRS